MLVNASPPHARGGLLESWTFAERAGTVAAMGIIITLLIVGVVLLILGVAVKAAMFLLWIGVILLIIGAIMWILRFVRGRAGSGHTP